MIKKFELYKESLLNNLRGPSEDEIINENPDLFLKISIENDNVEGVKKALDYGANPLSNNCVYFTNQEFVNGEINDMLFDYANLPKSLDDFNNLLFKDIKPNINKFVEDTTRYRNEYGVLFYYENNTIELSNEIYSIYRNVYLQSNESIQKIFNDYAGIDSKRLIRGNFSSFKLNKMLFDNKQLKESLLNKLHGPTDDEFIERLKDNPIELFKKSKQIGFKKGIEYAYKLFDEMEPNDLFYQGVLEKNYDILKYALEHGADVNMNGGFAIRQLKDLSLLNLLIKYGADIHSGNDQALFNAVLYNKYDVILFLIGKGANLYAQNQFMIETLIARQKLPQLKYFIEHKFIEYNKLNDDNKKYAEIYLPSDLFNKLKNEI